MEEIIALFSWRLQIALRDGGLTCHLGDDRGLGRRTSKHSKQSSNEIIQEALLNFDFPEQNLTPKLNFQLISKHLQLSLSISSKKEICFLNGEVVLYLSPAFLLQHLGKSD